MNYRMAEHDNHRKIRPPEGEQAGDDGGIQVVVIVRTVIMTMERRTTT